MQRNTRKTTVSGLGDRGSGVQISPLRPSFLIYYQELPSPSVTPHYIEIGTKQRQMSRRGAKNPEIIPKNVRRLFAPGNSRATSLEAPRGSQPIKVAIFC